MIVDRNLPAIQIVSFIILIVLFSGEGSHASGSLLEDRLGLTRELLDLLVLRGIDYAVLRLTPLGESTSILLNWI